MSKSALASLTAQYTDSENEDGMQDDESMDSLSSQVIIPKQPVNQIKIHNQEKPTTSALATSRPKKRKKSLRRLVSYQGEPDLSGEDEISESEYSTESESEEDDNNQAGPSSSGYGMAQKTGTSPRTFNDDLMELSRDQPTTCKSENSSKYAHYGITLPPMAKGRPPVELVEKIRNLHEKMKASNRDMNRIIQERKDFRNPSIYEKLIQYCDINEFGTNYPPEIYNPLQWGAESFYEELARVQKNEMIKRQKDRKESDKIEHATALARKVEEEAKRRKSKWDQPAIPTALTTTVTGTKGTVISAFGSLPKKQM